MSITNFLNSLGNGELLPFGKAATKTRTIPQKEAYIYASDELLLKAGGGDLNWQRRILILEDDNFIASLMSSVLSAKEFEVQVANDANSAKQIVQTFDPDLCLIDINLGEGPSGFHFGDWLKMNHPECVQVYLTNSTELRGWFDSASVSSARIRESNILSKRKIADSEELLKAIDEAFSKDGQRVIQPLEPHKAFRKLTHSQLQVLDMASQGLTNEEISQRRKTTKRTVEIQLQACYRALGLADKKEINQRVTAVKEYLAAKGYSTNEK